MSGPAVHQLGGLATLLVVTYTDRFLLPSPQHFSSCCCCCFLSAYFLRYTNSVTSALEEFLHQEMPSTPSPAASVLPSCCSPPTVPVVPL